MANRKTLAATRTAPTLAAHLATHGVEAVVASVASAGRRIEVVFADYAASCGADLIVMGAYGHARMHELVFGGVTRHVLREARLPVLFSG